MKVQTLSTKVLKAAIFLCFSSIPLLSMAESQDQLTNKIDSVSFIAAPGGRVAIHIKMTEPLTKIPVGFVLNDPARISLDFPKVANGTHVNSIKAGQGELKSISIADAVDRTRMVLNLTKKVTYNTIMNGNEVIVMLESNDTSVAKKPTSSAAVAKSSVENIDFIRGLNGEGRIVVDLSDESSGVSVNQKGNTIVVDLLNTEVPEKLQRRLNVINFNTPVVYVDTMKNGKNSRIIIEPKGNWEQSSYQTGKKFVIDVHQLVDNPNKLAGGSKPGFTGEKLSLNFQNIEVRAVLQVISDFTGLNIITSDSVTGNITLRLKDVKWDQALDIITKAKGLSVQKTDNVILVAPAEEVAIKEKSLLEAKRQIEDLEAVRTEVFTLNYMKADDLKSILTDSKQRILSKRGTAVVDVRTNTVFVQDTAKYLEQVQSIINRTDISVKQVTIEARIVIADNTYSKSLGARFGITKSASSARSSSAIGGSLGSVPTSTVGRAISLGPSNGTIQTASDRATLGTSTDALPQLMSNLPVANAFGSFAYSLLSLPAGLLLNLELSAMESDQKGKIISSPRITTANQHKAKIASGTEIPYLQASSSGASNVAFKSAVLSLEVTPQITPDNKIIMELDVKKDRVGQVYGGIPSIETQNIQTQVLVGNGETAVLGGIYEQTERNGVDKVPFFGDLPVMGNLFKKKTAQNDKTELLIFITPKVLDADLNIK